MRLAPLATVLFLAGCTTADLEAQRQVAAAQEISYCQNMGAKTEDQLFQCRMMVQQNAANAQVQKAQARRQFGAMLAAQDNWRYQVPPPQTPSRCHTSYSPGGMGFPPSATTNCY